VTNRQRYTGCSRVYRVYKGVQGVKEYTGYTRVYGLYKSIPGRQEYTRCTTVHGVRKYTEYCSIQGKQGCASPISGQYMEAYMIY